MSSDGNFHLFSAVSHNIRKCTLKRLKQFDSIRGRHVDIPFWDIVVITASDEAQKQAYEIQLAEKLKRKELPLGVTYHVFNDPPGPKIGNGGSTLICIAELLKLYGQEKLEKCKIMLANAGGYSQRMPNASILGKVFTALPWGNPPYQMIEMLMAMFIDFPVKMLPGILHVCPDTLELFNTGNETCSFTRPGFTALAHPSPIEIGTTHGVFVFQELTYPELMHQTECSKFLHKQSIEVMKDHKIVFQQEGKEYVYTDSIFFLDMSAAMKLHKLHSQITLDCEICAYGDFLQALGPLATSDYTRNVANVSKVESNLVKTRQLIFDYLKGTPLNVIVLNESRFYHLGTTAEYIHHFCGDPIFSYETSGHREVFVSYSGTPNTALGNKTVLMHCHVEHPIQLGAHSVLEYSDVGKDTHIGANCIISNVTLPINSKVPGQTFLMTVCVSVGGTMGLYVTAGYSISDNMKKKAASPQELDKITYFGRPLGDVFNHLGIAQEKWDAVTLWDTRMFPVFTCERSSVLYALEIVQAATEWRPFTPPLTVLEKRHGDTRLSMADILRCKDVQGTLNMRERLRQKIVANL